MQLFEQNIDTLENNIIEMKQTTNETIDQLTYIPRKICNIIYPIGSIFKAIESIDPNTIYSGTTWKLIDDSSDADIVNGYFNTNNLTVETYNDNSKWVPLYIYDATAAKYYTSSAEALHCATEGKISNLYLLQQTHDIFKNNNGEYEFRLEYPSLITSSGLGIQRWRQTSNPLQTQDTVTGYIPVDIDYTANNWGGLSTHLGLSNTSACLLTGCQNSTNVFYCIAPYVAAGNKGPSTTATGQVILYVRVPSLEKENLISNERNLLNYMGCKFWQRIT